MRTRSGTPCGAAVRSVIYLIDKSLLQSVVSPSEGWGYLQSQSGNGGGFGRKGLSNAPSVLRDLTSSPVFSRTTPRHCFFLLSYIYLLWWEHTRFM